MARYLTPAKIGLLALVYVYTEAIVPAEATIPILSFLISHISPLPDTEHGTEIDNSIAKGVDDIEVLQKATISYASGIPGRTVWDLLLNRLWEIDSLDALHVFFEHLSLLLKKNTEIAENTWRPDPVSNRILLARSSPIGAFVRRAQLEFSRLQFSDSQNLWQRLVAYRLSTMSQWRKRNPLSVYTGFDINLDLAQARNNIAFAKLSYDFTSNAQVLPHDYSDEDMERLLQFQVNQIQKTGTRLPKDTINQLHSFLNGNPASPSRAHYVQFLEAWKAGDYSSSFDHLHRYFDYTMHNQDQMFYQYALLNLAALHADYGAYTEAIVAMHETVSTAREHHDLICLNYSLSWLYHFGKAHAKELHKLQEKGVIGTDKEALTFLKAKAKETHMWCIFTTAILGEARLCLSNGESPSQALESVLKASQVHLSQHLPNTIGSRMSLQSSVFGRLGINCQAWLLQKLFLCCYEKNSPAEDILHCVCRIAFLLAQKGRYLDAIARMENVDQQTLTTLNYQRFWAAHTGMLKMRKCLRSNQLDAADQIMTQLRPLKELNQEMSYGICVLEIDLKSRRMDFPGALSLLEFLMRSLDDGAFDIQQRVKLMCLKAYVLDKAGTPQKGFSVALRASTLAHQAMILPVLWDAIGTLCSILHSVKEFRASKGLLESIMPQLLESDDCELIGRSFSLLADAHVGLAGTFKASPKRRKEQLSKGLENLDVAFLEYSKIEDAEKQGELLAKKATIMHLNEDPVLANDCAAQYLAIKKTAKERS